MKAHRLWIVAFAVMVVTAACSSSTSVGASARLSLPGSYDGLWLAAQAAVQDLGGRIAMASQPAGTLAARLDIEGRSVQLDVTLTRPPGGGSGFTDISAYASLVGIENPDPAWRDELRDIVDRYLELVERRSARVR